MRGKASVGDQLHNAGTIRRDDGARGRSPVHVHREPARAPGSYRTSGTISGVYRFADGAIFIEAEGTFDDSDTDRGAIVGGTGAYASARGTVESDKTRDVLHLLP